MAERKVSILNNAAEEVAHVAYFIESKGLPKTAKKFVDDSETKSCHQPVLIAHDIEDHPVISNNVRHRVGPPNVIKVTPRSLFTHAVPGFQWLPGVSVMLIEFDEGLSANNIHNSKSTERVGKKPTF